jgi:formyltetrahydrofolate hydrolase
MEVAGIISNHARQALNFDLDADIPSHYLPVTRGTKARQEDGIKKAACYRSSTKMGVFDREQHGIS